jgi:hypothetical protein
MINWGDFELKKRTKENGNCDMKQVRTVGDVRSMLNDCKEESDWLDRPIVVLVLEVIFSAVLRLGVIGAIPPSSSLLAPPPKFFFFI